MSKINVFLLRIRGIVVFLCHYQENLEAQKWGGLPLGVGVRIVGGSGESFIAAKRREKFLWKPSIVTGKNF